MELKRILARDSRSANEKAIQLYGPEVLIISTQRVDQQTELIVAVDVAAETMRQAAFGSASPMPAQAPRASAAAQPGDDGFVPFSKVFERVNDPAPVVAAPVQDMLDEFVVPVFQMCQPVGTASHQAPGLAEQGLPVQVLDTFAKEQALAAPYEQQRSQEIVDLLRQEMAALRKEFALTRQIQPWQQTLGLSEDMQKLTAAMVEVGMPAGLRSLLTDSIQGLDTLDEALPIIQRLLIDALKQPAVAVPDQGIHVLCGPTGSGKTSMLGRLAFAAAQTHGAEQQVMISFADQRPGAWSQIQLLAAQAGAACFRAADLTMLKTLLDELQGKTIWIDTPGIDFALQAQQMMQQNHAMALHAVLPVDATVTNVQKIVQKNDIRWSSLMLTKMDEAAYPWPLLSSLCDQHMPVSCVAEDHHIRALPTAFDAQRLVALALAPLHSVLAAAAPAPAPVEVSVEVPVVARIKTVRKPRTSPAKLTEPVTSPAVRTRARAVKTPATAKAA